MRLKVFSEERKQAELRLPFRARAWRPSQEAMSCSVASGWAYCLSLVWLPLVLKLQPTPWDLPAIKEALKLYLSSQASHREQDGMKCVYSHQDRTPGWPWPGRACGGEGGEALASVLSFLFLFSFLLDLLN